MSAPLAAKVAVVTGASRGIGKTIATHLSSLGAAVAAVDQDIDRGELLVGRLRSEGRQAVFVHADLSKPADARQAVKHAVASFGRIDILVNNAADHGQQTPAMDMSLDEWSGVINTNLTGTFLMSQGSARVMIAQGSGGVIINLLAIQSQLPIPGYGPYCVSKGGLDALTRVLAVELAAAGIRVNGIVVGSVYTESVRAVLPPELTASDDLEMVPPLLDKSAATLVGRMGRPSDIARVVAFLASDDAAYLTGALITADGGRLLNRRPDPFVSRRDQDP